MLHIKLNGITKFSNTVANILPADRPLPYDPIGNGPKGQNSGFQKMVMLHIKLKVITNSATE